MAATEPARWGVPNISPARIPPCTAHRVTSHSQRYRRGFAVTDLGSLKMAFGTLFVVLNLAVAAAGGSLADVKHLVMIMFENRSFDHVSLLLGVKWPVSNMSIPSILAQWQEFVASPIQMCKSTHPPA